VTVTDRVLTSKTATIEYTIIVENPVSCCNFADPSLTGETLDHNIFDTTLTFSEASDHAISNPFTGCFPGCLTYTIVDDANNYAVIQTPSSDETALTVTVNISNLAVHNTSPIFKIRGTSNTDPLSFAD